MLKIFRYRFARLAFLFLLVPVSAFSKICVLSIFAKNTWESNAVARVFKYYNKADLFQEPSLTQIENCFASGDYEEIVWLSHGLDPVKSRSSYSAPIFVFRDSNNLLNKITLPIRFFEKLAKIANTSRLKKMRVAVCGVDSSFDSLELQRNDKFNSTIEVLLRDLHSNSVAIDFAPEVMLARKILNQHLSILDTHWLFKSIDLNDIKQFTHWATERSENCTNDYLPSECNRDESILVFPLP